MCGQEDRKQLGEMLLSNTPHSNRTLMTLITRVEERELLQVRHPSTASDFNKLIDLIVTTDDVLVDRTRWSWWMPGFKS